MWFWLIPKQMNTWRTSPWLVTSHQHLLVCISTTFTYFAKYSNDNLDIFSECFPNGTMTALAVKLESVPSLDPSELTLRDSSCGPVYSDERYAYFVFTVNSCGTTRKVMQTVFNWTRIRTFCWLLTLASSVFTWRHALWKWNRPARWPWNETFHKVRGGSLWVSKCLHWV